MIVDAINKIKMKMNNTIIFVCLLFLEICCNSSVYFSINSSESLYSHISEDIFIPKFFIGSLITTVVTIVLMILFHFIKKVFDIRNIKFITFIFWLFGLFIYILVMIKFYIISIWQTLI